MNLHIDKKVGVLLVIALLVGGVIGGAVGFAGQEGHGREGNMMEQDQYDKQKDSEMMSDQAMHTTTDGLQGKTGDAFDKAFLSLMITHHQSAVDMAKLVLTTSKRPELIKLANGIIAAQTKEIGMMQDWQKTWFNQ